MKQLNNSTTQQLFSTAKIIILALVLGLGISYAQANWAPPLASPPNCTAGNPGCDAPLNVGATAQIKTGDLTAGGVTLKKVATPTGYSYYSYISPSETTSGSALTSGALYLTSAFAGFRNLAGNNWRWLVLDNGNTFQAGTATIAGGSPDVGKVLTATDATGASTWQAPATAASGAPTFITPIIIVDVSVPVSSNCAPGVCGVWTTYNAASIIPAGAKVVILGYDYRKQYFVSQAPHSCFGGAPLIIKIRKNSSSPQYTVVSDGHDLESYIACPTLVTSSVQRFFPVSDTRTFDYYISGHWFFFKLSIIGYM